MLSGEITSETSRRLIQEFVSNFRDGAHIEFEPLQLTEIAESQQVSYGTDVLPQYRFDLADIIVSLGADFLGGWLSPVEYSRTWSKKKKLFGQKASQATLSKLICFESNFTITGGSSDERYPLRPGDELKVALALVYELIVNQKHSSFVTDSTLVSVLSGYKPEVIASEIGMQGGAPQLKKIADQLWANRGKSLVVGGGVQSKTKDALALQVAVNLLNSILGNEGLTVDGTAHTGLMRGHFSSVVKLIQELNAGQVDALIIYRSNPGFTLRQRALDFIEAAKKAPLIILISDREDETGLVADYILPDHHYLENWGDSNPRKGLYSIQQPAIAPIHSTRSFQDTLIQWVKGIGTGNQLLAAKVPDWHDYLLSHWKENQFKASGSIATFEQFWEGVLRQGVLDLYSSKGLDSGKPAVRSFRNSSLSVLPKYQPLDPSRINLVIYESTTIGDGRSANNPWLQELPDPISSVTWDNYLNISPALAKKLNIQNDDVIEITASDQVIELPAYVQPGLHSSVVSIAIGYGRRAVGKVGNLAGVDLFPLVEVIDNRLSFSGKSVVLKKTGKYYKLASTQWHTSSENRPIINDISLAEFRKNPAKAQHTDPHLRLETVPSIWPSHEYKSYRWGMAIDLNTCTGCGACVIACQAENNIPVVGRDQVRVGRQMHWLRIDRYYAGSPDHPDVVFQPMLCQHCENAPCETVCPVLATVHDDEGLNVQVYNRCVGTRYCQNNCPYKVRRFNFFDHWKSYEGTMNLAWNPDVTVRTRGIMEKCTFCVQRIRDAKDKAKDANERVRDGEIKTACQQSCATDAIIFGDINDPESLVSRLKESPQAFRVLEVLNTKPVISYLTKVRNKPEGAHATEGAGHAEKR